MRAPHIDKTAISPYDDYCDGYGMPGAYGNGYVSVLKVSAGTVEKTNDELVDRIVTYDKAEAADAYVGQINMLTASSFCGMAGHRQHECCRNDDVAQKTMCHVPLLVISLCVVGFFWPVKQEFERRGRRKFRTSFRTSRR